MSETATSVPSPPRVGITELQKFITRALTLGDADARGGDAHSIFRLQQYVKQIQSGGINARPNIRIVSDRAGAALIDGDNALGHLVMKRAVLARKRARSSSVG